MFNIKNYKLINMNLIRLSFAFFLFSIAVLRSQSDNGFQAILSIENDVFGINNADENYTGGLKLDILSPSLNCRWLPFIRLKNKNFNNIQRYGFGGTGYTPQKIDSVNIINNDRPYSSLTFVSFGNTSYSQSVGIKIQSDLIVGIMGLSGPGKVQSYLHEKHALGSTRPIPMGWHNQIGNGGAIIVNYNTIFSKLLIKGKHILKSNHTFNWIQSSGLVNLNVGNYMTNFELGAKFNILNLNTSILQDYNNQIPSLIDGLRKKIRFNIIVEPIIRYSIYNSTLEGLMCRDNSVYKIDHKDVERIIFDFRIGTNVVIMDNFFLGYYLWGRSKEYAMGKNFHWWGGITIGGSPSRWFTSK
jgi:lipid A 3-O-deacylase